MLLGSTSTRERRLGMRLDAELAPIGAVMHGCRIGDDDHPIDHLVVAPSGIWVVIADHSDGPFERVAGGGDQAVRIGGVDAGDRLEAVRGVAERVRGVLDGLDHDWVEVTPSMCFTNLRVRAVEVDGVRLVTARRLVNDIATRGSLLQRDARRIAGAIGRELVIDDDPTRRA